MRDCYKKFWKKVMIAKFHESLPQFELKETPSRKVADDLMPSAKPIEFVWNPVDKLTFKLIFTAHTRQDDFWAYCQWSETGKAKVAGQGVIRFADNAWNRVDGFVHLQSLSVEIDQRGSTVQSWDFWKPMLDIGSTRESHAAYMAEIVAEEMRQISDDVAQQRVEAAVEKTVVDVKRCAMPWFEKKLAWYMQNKANVP